MNDIVNVCIFKCFIPIKFNFSINQTKNCVLYQSIILVNNDIRGCG